MKKILIFLAIFTGISCLDKSSRKMQPFEITEAIMIKNIPGYKSMAEIDQKKATLDVAKGARRGLHLQRLLELDQMYEAGGIVGTKMKQMDQDFCKLIDSLDNQISKLEKELKSDVNHADSSSLRRIGEKIGRGIKYTWNKIKTECTKVKNKVFKNSSKKEALVQKTA